MTFEKLRTQITGELERLSAAIVDSIPDDQEFADAQLKRTAALHGLVERAETVPQLARVQKRLTSIMRESARLLPPEFFVRNRRTAEAATRMWIRRRDKLVSRLLRSSPWVLAPYQQPGSADDEDARSHYDQSSRCCIAITAEDRAAVVDEIELLAIEAPAIAAMNNVGAVSASRNLWLPVLVPAGFQKLVYCTNTAYSVLPSTVRYLEVVVGKEVMALDVNDFLAKHGWRRDQVTIRRASGSRFVARLWDADGNVSRIQTHCVIVDYAGDLPKRITTQYSRARRIDAKDPAAIWHCFEFVYYPGGRPSRVRKNH